MDFQCLGCEECWGCFGTWVIVEIHLLLDVPWRPCVPGRVTVVCSETQSSDTLPHPCRHHLQGDILSAVQSILSCLARLPVQCTQGIQTAFHLYFCCQVSLKMAKVEEEHRAKNSNEMHADYFEKVLWGDVCSADQLELAGPQVSSDFPSSLASLDWLGVRVAQLAQSRWIWFCQELWNCTGLRVRSFSASWLV